MIGAYVAGHSYTVPLVGYGGGSGQPSAEQEKKVDSGQDVDNASPMPQRMVLDSRMYCTDISLDRTIKSPGNDKTQNRRFSQYPENRRGHAEVSFVHLDAIVSSSSANTENLPPLLQTTSRPAMPQVPISNRSKEELTE